MNADADNRDAKIAANHMIDSVDEIAARLCRLRNALGHANSAGAFARSLGITGQAWSNYEGCRRRIELDQAVKVVKATGVTLDWIYRGVEHALPHELVQKLSAVAAG